MVTCNRKSYTRSQEQAKRFLRHLSQNSLNGRYSVLLEFEPGRLAAEARALLHLHEVEMQEDKVTRSARATWTRVYASGREGYLVGSQSKAVKEGAAERSRRRDSPFITRTYDNTTELPDNKWRSHIAYTRAVHRAVHRVTKSSSPSTAVRVLSPSNIFLLWIQRRSGSFIEGRQCCFVLAMRYDDPLRIRLTCLSI